MIEREYYSSYQGLDYFWENAIKTDLVKFHESYKETLANEKRIRNKLINRNKDLEKENYENAKYIVNKNIVDIRILNSIIRDLEWTIIEIESYLPYDKREFLHKQNKNYSNAILEVRSNEGFNPDGMIKFPPSIDVEKLIENEELQKILFDVMKLLCSEMQIKCIYMFYWDNMKQREIADELKISQQAVAKNLQKGIQKMQNHLKYLDLKDFL